MMQHTIHVDASDRNSNIVGARPHAAGQTLQVSQDCVVGADVSQIELGVVRTIRLPFGQVVATLPAIVRTNQAPETVVTRTSDDIAAVGRLQSVLNLPIAIPVNDEATVCDSVVSAGVVHQSFTRIPHGIGRAHTVAHHPAAALEGCIHEHTVVSITVGCDLDVSVSARESLEEGLSVRMAHWVHQRKLGMVIAASAVARQVVAIGLTRWGVAHAIQ
mmetsp:Transcript_71346/g.170840  ORF Transcript_71346/g.170840 Transcript_71346/m.170840 type:complete len:217 (+) Transcript_71346:79-729(+)